MSRHSCVPIKPGQELLNWLDESWEINQDGQLVWARDGETRNIKKGMLICHVKEASGYITCRTSTNPRKKFRAHHLAWYFTTGEWPAKEIDHIDGDRTNNHPNNLRLASKSQNLANRGAVKNRTLPKNVYQIKGRSKYVAVVARRYAGVYDTPEAAKEAATNLGQQLFGGFYK